jgi:ribulose-5-phosphate 4-epimerase/fuculose-1-phosphate aldolase
MVPELASEDRELIDALVAAAREARAEGLVVSSSGNFSVRLDDGRFAISGSRTRLGSLRPEDVLVLDLGDAAGEPALAGGGRDRAGPGSLRPSMETPMHSGLYRSCRQIRAILHFQSRAATALACRGESSPDLNFIPEFPVYLRRLGEVPYLTPGSAELARAVVDAFQDPEVRIVQLRNHGQVVIGDTPAQAVERATFFELACHVFLLSEAGKPLRRFTTEELERLRSF